MPRILPLLALLLALVHAAWAEDPAPVARFDEALAAAARGEPLPDLAVGPAEADALGALVADAQAPERARAVALALLGSVAKPAERERVTQVLDLTSREVANSKSHAPPDPLAILARVLNAPEHALRAEHAPYLAHRAYAQREPLPLAALGWAPGTAARAALLSFVAGEDAQLDAAHIVALGERARRDPDDRLLLVRRLAAEPPLAPLRRALLLALAPLEDEAVVSAWRETVEALAAAPAPPDARALDVLHALRGSLPHRRFASEPFPAPAACGPALARLVERWPDLIATLEAPLRACAAPVRKELLWSRLGQGRDDAPLVNLLLPRLEASDEAALLQALAVERADHGSLYLRLKLVEQGPAALRTPAVHAALWRIAEALGGEHGGGRTLAAEGAVRALALYRDAADTARLASLLARTAQTEALREVLRRDPDPTARFLALLASPDPEESEAAETALIVHHGSHPALPLPATLPTWRRIAALLEERILREQDLGPRSRRLQAYATSTVPGPLSPMYGRTPDDERAQVTFFGRMLAELAPPPDVRAWVARLLSFSRVPEALDVLRTLEADPDAAVARVARETAEQVRQALGR